MGYIPGGIVKASAQYDAARLKEELSACQLSHIAWSYGVFGQSADPLLSSLIAALNLQIDRNGLTAEDLAFTECFWLDQLLDATPSLCKARFSEDARQLFRDAETERQDRLPPHTSIERTQILSLLRMEGFDLESHELDGGGTVDGIGIWNGKKVAVDIGGIGSYCAVPKERPLGKVILKKHLTSKLGSYVHIPIYHFLSSTKQKPKGAFVSPNQSDINRRELIRFVEEQFESESSVLKHRLN